jgi:hypothetical protein
LAWPADHWRILYPGWWLWHANIMFVSVKERTNIIGIQKSLGAKNFFILFHSMFEAIFLSLIGGGNRDLPGFADNLHSAKLAGNYLSIKNITVGLSVSVIIGLVSGIIPAVLASNLDPVIRDPLQITNFLFLNIFNPILTDQACRAVFTNCNLAIHLASISAQIFFNSCDRTHS